MNSEGSTADAGKHDKGADGYTTLTVPYVDPINLFHCLTECRELKTCEGVEKQLQKLLPWHSLKVIRQIQAPTALPSVKVLAIVFS
jgi:hypothetical protein